MRRMLVVSLENVLLDEKLLAITLTGLMRAFASDNYAPALPEALEAIAAANTGQWSRTAPIP